MFLELWSATKMKIYSLKSRIRSHNKESSTTEIYLFHYSPSPTTILDRNLQGVSPLWCVDDDSHQAARDDSRDRESKKPSEINPRYHPPVDCLEIASTNANSNCSAGDALRRRYG